jgi:MFS family permease
VTSRAARPRFSPDFLRLFTSTGLSGLGDGCRITALAVFATTLTGSPVLIALVTVASRVPWAVVGPFAGALTDAVAPWRAMWLCLAGRAAAAAAFTVLVVTGNASIWLLIAVSFVVTSIDTLADNLEQAVVPQVAGGASLETANSWIMGAQSVTTDFLGTPLGPVLLAVAVALPFGTDALLSATSAVLIWTAGSARRPAPDPRTPAGPAVTPRSLGRGAVQGLRWLWQSGSLRIIALVIFLVNFSNLTVLGIAVLYAVHVLHVSSTSYGLLLLVIGIGGLTGLVLAPRFVAWLGRPGALLLAIAVCPAAFAVIGLTSNVAVVAPMLSFLGLATELASVVTLSMRQDSIPQSQFGRVNAAYRLIVNGIPSAGGLLGGVVASLAGLRAPFFVSAALTAIAAIAALQLAVSGHTTAPAGDDAEPAQPQDSTR